jgi:hypothetical protein
MPVRSDPCTDENMHTDLARGRSSSFLAACLPWSSEWGSLLLSDRAGKTVHPKLELWRRTSVCLASMEQGGLVSRSVTADQQSFSFSPVGAVFVTPSSLLWPG